MPADFIRTQHGPGFFMSWMCGRLLLDVGQMPDLHLNKYRTDRRTNMIKSWKNRKCRELKKIKRMYTSLRLSVVKNVQKY